MPYACGGLLGLSNPYLGLFSGRCWGDVPALVTRWQAGSISVVYMAVEFRRWALCVRLHFYSPHYNWCITETG